MGLKESKKPWVCQHGCNQTYHLKKYGKGCPHLEDLIKPKKRQRVLDILFTDNIEKFERYAIKVITEKGFYNQIGELASKLKKYRLTDRQVVIIVDRLCNSKSYTAIAKDLDVSKQYIEAEYKRALKKLREREFK